MRLTFEREGGSIKGEDDFFSVARTIPFVAREEVRILDEWHQQVTPQNTFDTQSGDALIDCI